MMVYCGKRISLRRPTCRWELLKLVTKNNICGYVFDSSTSRDPLDLGCCEYGIISFRFCDRQEIPYHTSYCQLLLLLLLLLLLCLHVNLLPGNLRHNENCSGIGMETLILDWNLGLSQVLYTHEISQQQIQEFSFNPRPHCSSGRQSMCLIQDS
jgi:hypothetical protein